MTPRHSIIITLAVCLTVMLVSIATIQGQQQGNSELRIAVVDVNDVFNSLAERRAVEADLRAQREQIQADLQDREQELRDLQEDLNVLDGDAAAQVREQLRERAVEFQVAQQVAGQRWESEQQLRLLELYRRITSSIERIANEEGYDLVLYDEKLPSLDDPQAQAQILERMNDRVVLHANGRLDITDRLIQRMNNEFENR